MRPSQAAFDYIENIADLDDEESIRDLLLKHSRTLGFDKLIVAELPKPREPLQVHLCNWPVGFFEVYRSHLYRYDPLARHANQTTEPFVWSEVHWDRSRSSPEQQLMSMAADFGLEDGLVVPILGLDGDQCVIGLSGRPGRIQPSDRRALHLMCLFTYHAIRRIRLAGEGAPLRRTLTATERDCLAFGLMVGDAHSISERVPLSASEVVRHSWRAARVAGAARPLQAAIEAVLNRELIP
jgi:LuxR family quorum sensing-dependent transcriptional regulator